MRAVLQRVTRARVTVEGRVAGEIGAGLAILLGVGREDAAATASALAAKIVHLRIFGDALGKMNQSLLDVRGEALIVSQFTLYAETRGQRRPSFLGAAPPEHARALYEEFVRAMAGHGVRTVTGVFGANMRVEIVNDGPVTIWLDTAEG